MEEVHEFLTTMDSMVKEIAQRQGVEDRKLLSFESIVLELGQGWTAKARPAGMRKLRDGYCYGNAWKIMNNVSGLRYVEGYAMTPFSLLPVQHGWCVNDQDEVVDPTWKEAEHSAYYGVVIPDKLLGCSMWLTRVYGFFGHVRTGRLIRELGRLPTCDELKRAYEEDDTWQLMRDL